MYMLYLYLKNMNSIFIINIL